MRTHQGLHDAHNTITRTQSTSGFYGLLCFRDLDSSDYPVVACFQPPITLRHWSHPFHREILQSQKQSSKVVTFKFDIVRGKRQAQRFRFASVSERRGDEVLVWKNVRVAGRCLDAQTWARRFTLPACGGCLDGLSASFCFHVADSNHCGGIGCSTNASS